MTEYILIEHWCPFLTCFEAVPHTHPICETCGAVRYGNMMCRTCWEYHGRWWPEPTPGDSNAAD